MNLKDEKKWKKLVEINTDPYSKCCIDIARRTMKIMDESKEIDSCKILHKARREMKEDITIAMAGMIAKIVSECHSRGDEFRISWNVSYYEDEETQRVVNPAFITLKDNI